MSKNNTAKSIFTATLLCSFIMLVGVVDAFATTFKIATLSPGGSYWVDSFKAGAKEISERTEGRVKFRFYPGGVMGSEPTVLRKMQIGQLQGGAISGGSLYGFYPDASLYGLPFTFSSRAEVEYVRARLDDDIKAGAEEAGFTIAGLMGGGFAYIMSQKPIHSFDDVKNHKVWVPDNDPQTADTLKKLGINPIPLGVGDVLMGLQTGLIDTVTVPPVVAIALQWHTRVKYLVKVPILYTMGTLTLNKRDFKKLSKADQSIVIEVFGRVANDIYDRNISDDNEAFTALSEQGIKIIEPKGKNLESWQALEKEVQNLVLTTGNYSPDLLSAMQKLIGTYKAK